MYGRLRASCDKIFFSLLEKITILLFEQSKPIIKILLKDCREIA